MRSKKSGFTLLELIIVVIVIGILASIALPRYIAIAEKGRASEAKSILSALRAAQIRYSAQYGTWTTNMSRVDIGMTDPGKYFDFNLINPGTTPEATADSAVLANATRNTVDNPTSAYTVTITQGGNLSYSGTNMSVL